MCNIYRDCICKKVIIIIMISVQLCNLLYRVKIWLCTQFKTQ